MGRQAGDCLQQPLSWSLAGTWALFPAGDAGSGALLEVPVGPAAGGYWGGMWLPIIMMQKH